MFDTDWKYWIWFYSDEFLLMSVYHNNLVVYNPGWFICLLGSGMMFIKDKEISSNQPAYNDEGINLECFRSAEFWLLHESMVI